ncbi:MAG: hypothetical protein CGW95_01170 [Phenylobacterium zucineum]|nr:MAG: hypothetical protein CGW95_01170 [Phenylobacterium zucineum]
MARSVKMLADHVDSPSDGVTLSYGKGGVYPIDGANMTRDLAKKIVEGLQIGEYIGEEEELPLFAEKKTKEK